MIAKEASLASQESTMLLHEDVKAVANCLRREVCEAVRLSGREVVQSVRQELDKQARYLSASLTQDLARELQARPREGGGRSPPEREKAGGSRPASSPAAVQEAPPQRRPLHEAPPKVAKKSDSNISNWTGEDDETWASIIPSGVRPKQPGTVSFLGERAPSAVTGVSRPEEDPPPKMPGQVGSLEGAALAIAPPGCGEGGTRSEDLQHAQTGKLSHCSSSSSALVMVNPTSLSKTANRIKNVRKTLREDKSQLKKNFLRSNSTSSMAVVVESSLAPPTRRADSCGSSSRLYDFQRGVYSSMVNGTFDAVVCILLLANAIFIGIGVDMAVRDVEIPGVFRVLDVVFCFAFMIELGLRIAVERMNYFLDGELWNYFDVLLVGVQLFDLILYFASYEDHGLDQGILVRILRVLRLIRVLRLLRVIRFVADLRKVVYLMMGSLQSFTWTMTLLVLLMYILAVFFTQLVADSKSQKVGGSKTDEIIDQAFGSVPASVFTLYKAITGGMDWQDVSSPLVETINPLVGFMFAFYTAFAILVLLNLVTGVFVDGALKLSRADKEVDLTRKAYQVFKTTDDDHSGAITWEEFREKLDTPEMAEFFEALEINLARAEDLFQLLEHSGDGMLDLEELVAGGMLLQGPAKAIDVAALFKYLQSGIERMEDKNQLVACQLGVVEDKLEDMCQLLRNKKSCRLTDVQ